MIRWLKKDGRQALILIGMGLFGFAALGTVINVMALPYARAFYGYSWLIVLAGFVLMLSVLLGIGKKIKNADTARLERIARVCVPAYILVLFMIHLLMGYFMEYTPSGDNFMIYTSAQMLATDGNFDAYPDFYLYLSRFSNQWGFMLMLSGVYRILFSLGVTHMFFPTVVIQAVLYACGMSAVMAIARRIGGVRCVLMTIAALVFCFPIHLAAAVLYTDTFSLPFVMISLLFALRMLDAKTARGQLGNALVCAVFSAVGGQIKMTVAIVVIAAVILAILRLPALRAALCCAVIVLTMGLSMAVVQKAMIGPILDEDMVAQHNTPAIHWIMMSMPSGSVPYGTSIEDYRETWTMMEEGASREEVMQSIYTRLKDKVYYLRYPNRLIPAMLRKNSVAFGDGTFGMTEMLDDSPVRENLISSIVLQGRPGYEIYMPLCTGAFAAQLLLAALSCVRDIRKKETGAALLYVAAFGLMVFMLLWEVRGRYIFNFVVVFLLLCAKFCSAISDANKKEAA